MPVSSRQSSAFPRQPIPQTTQTGPQRRKGTPVPYVAHLMGAAALVLEHGGDEDQAIDLQRRMRKRR